MNPQRNGFFPIVLHLAALIAFVLAPLYNLLGSQAEFFSANLVPPVAIVVLTILASLVFPAFLAGMVWSAGFINHRFQIALFSTLLFTFTALIMAGFISHIAGVSLFLYMLLVVVASAAFLVGYFKIPACQSLLSCFSPAALIFPIIFLFFSNVTPELFPLPNKGLVLPKADAARTYPPVVMVIFDEVALSSLLKSGSQIDEEHYPGFARLAKGSTWFKGAHTVADNTLDAVPAIITGQYPKGTERTTNEKNDNIFTLLGTTHQMAVTEKVTQLCPAEFCKRKVNLFKSVQKLARDTSVVYLYLLLPEELRRDLPDITQNWGDFKLDGGEADKRAGRPAETTAANPKDEGHNHRVRLFEEFTKHITPMGSAEKPKFYFIHILLPHVPFIFLPSGKYYGTGRSIGPHFPFPWNHDDRLLTEHYQRHLLQLGAADHQLEKLLDKLQETHLYDRSLVIVVADHGLNFRGGHPRRNIDQGNYDEMLPVPLFIKQPNQKQPEVIEKPVRIMDIYPTLAELMVLSVPKNGHGKSVYAKDYPVYKNLRICMDKHSDKSGVFPVVTQAQISQQVAVKTHLFGQGGADYLFHFGPHKDWIGRPVDTLGIPVQPARQQWSYFVYDLADYETVDLNSKYVPSMITGELYGSSGDMLPKDIWVAVNGVLWSTYPVLEKSGNKMTFYAMIPEQGFRQGKNKIQVLVPDGDAKQAQTLWSVAAKP